MFRYNDPVEAAKLRREGKAVKFLNVVSLHSWNKSCWHRFVFQSELNRSRLSFLSWSMPDLAHSNEGLLASPRYLCRNHDFFQFKSDIWCLQYIYIHWISSKLQLARLIGDSSIPGNRKVLEKRLLEVQSSLDEAKKKLKDDWDVCLWKTGIFFFALQCSRY